ncbi:MAG: hypothetical protein J7M25_15600 [Deltaproteobacteria bacterium]|nr:hypothetical protein [Deltaproteobacteria bacterium]
MNRTTHSILEQLIALAMSLLDCGQYDLAEAALMELGTLAPDRPITWGGACLAALLSGHPKRAEAHLARLYHRHPTLPLTNRLEDMVAERKASMQTQRP